MKHNLALPLVNDGEYIFGADKKIPVTVIVYGDDKGEANAAYIVHCVNNHKRLVEACKEALKTLEFLKEYEPRPRNATNMLQQALAQAKEQR